MYVRDVLLIPRTHNSFSRRTLTQASEITRSRPHNRPTPPYHTTICSKLEEFYV